MKSSSYFPSRYTTDNELNSISSIFFKGIAGI